MAEFQTVRGMRDFGPEEMRKRTYVMSVIRSVFERYGYEELQTPALEYLDLFLAKGSGGDEIKKEIYSFKDQGDRDVGMKFDLTVPTCRYVATNLDIPKPFKRYMMQPVWRYDRPQAGRYREFWQCDVDVFGAENGMVDIETLAVFADVLKELGFKDFTIRINNKKILEGLVLSAGIAKEKTLDAFRSIDKLEKLGEGGVKKEFEQRGVDNGDKLLALVKMSYTDAKKKLKGTKIAEEGIAELDEVLSYAKAFGIDGIIKVDLALVRGLEYYTGCVFELAVEGGKWSVAGGGRFDKMVEDVGGQPTPATGWSFGFERIVVLMDELGLFRGKVAEANADAYVAPVNDETRTKAVEIAQALRKKGIRTDMDLVGRSLSKQLDYASSKKMPYIVIVGSKDLKNNEITVRDMKSGKEEKVKLDRLAAFFVKK